MKYKKLITMLLISCNFVGILYTTNAVLANSIEEAREQTEDELKSASDQIKNIETGQIEIKNEIANAEEQLVELLAEQETLALEVSILQEELTIAHQELKVAQAEADAQYETMILQTRPHCFRSLKHRSFRTVFLLILYQTYITSPIQGC